MRHITKARGSYVFAGGLNNEYDKACLAILRVGSAPSRSPQSAGTRFECIDGPQGQPDRYFLFPPTDVSHALNQPYNRIRQIQALGSQVTVISYEDGAGQASAMYELSEGFEPTDLILADGFGVLHRHLQEQGLIEHDLAHCPHLKMPTVVDRWGPQAGWSKVNVPPSGSVKPGALL